MYKEYWIYQKQAKSTPWAICIGRTYSKRNKKLQSLDFTIYSEDIQSPTKSIYCEHVEFSTIAAFVQRIETQIKTFAQVTEEDHEQLFESIERIILD